MRLLIVLLSVGVLSGGSWWLYTAQPQLKHKVQSLLASGHFRTLEVRYTPQQIMDVHRKTLLKDARYKYLQPTLTFYPYLLMEVKYTLTEEMSREGMLLWDMIDGEIVLSTREWDKTHGFGDCLSANTNANEFKILNLLSSRGGCIDRDALCRSLRVDNEILDAWIDSCRKKKLIVQTGNRYRLHLQNPKLKALPETRIDEHLVTKPYQNALRLSPRFSFAQVEKVAKAAFGADFAVRKTTDVFLPVYSIVVQNPDGSTHTTLWNALNGHCLLSPSLSYHQSQ